MNHVVLIGNGFDLAHGLKTSYMDFILWYMKNIGENVENAQFYEDDIVKVVYEEKRELNPGYYQDLPKPIFQKGQLSNSPKELFKNLVAKKYKPLFKSRFIEELFLTINDSNWVDIEYQYFSWLVWLYKAQLDSKFKNAKSMLLELNKSYTEIIIQLEKYLSLIDINRDMNPKDDIHAHFAKIKNNSNILKNEKILIVNFNYTNSVNEYFDQNDNIDIIQIHGRLNDSKNPIVFGYGDEADKYYDEIEKLNDNEYLRFMKSFGYAKTSNYQDIIKFLNSDYEVHIMGHSCGLSDRLLLKRIFENKHCSKINIYYYEISETETDYINKYMDISRHFSIDKKEIMREKITTKNHSLPLVKYKA
ncbi:MAG: hypothetical protein C0448_03520 [Sphingobacteriaceae bacterium]|nr:hypothetical protein [Sphingobacteriaceae bacterium]